MQKNTAIIGKHDIMNSYDRINTLGLSITSLNHDERRYFDVYRKLDEPHYNPGIF